MKTNANKLTYDLLQLQNLIKRDSSSYYDEFCQKYQHFQPLLQVFKMSPEENNRNFGDMVMFMAQIFSCYPEDLKDLPKELMAILREYNTVLHSEIRMMLCRALILIRNKGYVLPYELMTLFFELLRSEDKILRKFIKSYIISDIKSVNLKHKNAKTNSVLQGFMYQMLADSKGKAAKMSLDIMVDLYRRHIWKDAKTVNAIAVACFSRVTKILVSAHQFFLGADAIKEDSDDSDSEPDVPTTKDVMLANKVNKKTRSRRKALKKTRKALKQSKNNNKKAVFDFSALHLIHDPQGMADRLLKNLQAMNERFEVKLMVMELIARLIGVHNLIVLNYYPLLQRYLQPRVRDVTKVLLFAAQAAHEQVPPDVMEQITRTIAFNFITERNSVEVMTVGINSIREICIRCPLAISEDLLQDLVQYKSYKNKNVSSAAKSLIQLFRTINPKMLQRKYRSTPTEATRELKPLDFGELDAKSYIPGAEVLPCEVVEEDSNEKSKDEKLDDSDDSWSDISDDESEGNPEIAADDTIKEEPPLETKVDKAAVVSQSRILSQEEFQKVKVAQVAKQVQKAKGKRKLEEEASFARGELVSLRDIEKLYKKPKMTKEEKKAIALEGKMEREYGKRQKKTPFSSKTQKEQNKNKAFMMIKHKFKAKVKRSFKDKQVALRNALLKRKRDK